MAHTGSDGNIDHLRDMLAAYMVRKGLRSTEQRRLIVETFFHSRAHITIEELLGQVRSADPRVGYATVYRTLKLLAESGVANERHFGDGVTRYEPIHDGEHHDHLICTSCGDIVEFEDDAIEERQDAIAQRYGYVVQSHKHEIYGLCPKCAAKLVVPHAPKKRSRRAS